MSLNEDGWNGPVFTRPGGDLSRICNKYTHDNKSDDNTFYSGEDVSVEGLKLISLVGGA